MATKPIAIKKESKTKQLDNNFIWLIMGLFIFVATLFYFYKSTNVLIYSFFYSFLELKSGNFFKF